MAQEFYVREDDSVYGPYSGRQLREMASSGALTPESLVSINQRKWLPASSIKELVFEESPPVEPGPTVAQRMRAGLQGAATAIGGAISGLAAGAPSSADVQAETNELRPPTNTGSASSSAISRFLNEEQDPKVIERLLPKVQEILMSGEELLFIAVQKKPIATIAPDCIILTSKRFIFYKVKLFGQIAFEDRIWRELYDAKIEEGILGAKFTIHASGGLPLSMDYLPKAQARRLYRFAQEMEEKSLEERRQRQLEDKRAAAGGIVLGAPTYAQPQAIPDDPLQKLSKLKQMLDAGLINSQEYESKKTEILSRM